ncbi:MAG: TA system VapC family ribonuclease toxin [Burkholderiales bacterium]
MRALLDVNVLVALLDGGHLHHRTATDWLGSHMSAGWASCPLTENGCVRILSLASYPNAQLPAEVAKRLAGAVAGGRHEFWADSLSLLEPRRLSWSHVLGSRRVTDAYLLALAVERKGRLVTFDRGIALAVVPGAEKRHLVTLG